MTGPKLVVAAGMLLLGSLPALGGDYIHPSAITTTAERIQLLYQAESRSVLRRTVKVWNPSPEKNLDFVWEPARGQPGDAVAIDGLVSGTGKLVWRVKGSASYDPKTVFSTYVGALREGRPEGKGRLEIRTGEVVDGDWKAGVPSGRVVWIDVAGNRYEGEFSSGKPNGKGRYLSINGAIFEGTFVDGQRDGEGETLLPGGTRYTSRWDNGREIGGSRPDVLADALVGGLLKAQSGGGTAGKVEIGVTVDERMNQQAEMQYQHLVREEDIAIYPLSDEANNYWNGTGSIPTGDYTFSGTDWEKSPIFVEVDVATRDKSRAKLAGLELKDIGSDAYRKPMLTISEHYGCVGFRPSFSLVNHGWGEVRDAKLSLSFTGEEDDGAKSRVLEKEIGTFDEGLDISIRDLLDQAGVDTGKLEAGRYSCQSRDSLNVCRSQVFNDVGFGEVADYVWGTDNLYTTATGTLSYSWADDAGNVFQQTEPYRAAISLANIELPEELAECGDGFGGSPEALNYQDIALRVGEKGYSIPLSIRGNKNVASYKARLKFMADKSSFHQFRVSASFADGSTRDSKPVSLFFFRPRPSSFVPGMKPASCYMKETAGC